MNKEQVLQEVLAAIKQKKSVGGNQLSIDSMSPYCGSEVAKYINTELDKLGYKLYAFHYTVDNKLTGESSGLKITW